MVDHDPDYNELDPLEDDLDFDGDWEEDYDDAEDLDDDYGYNDPNDDR